MMNEKALKELAEKGINRLTQRPWVAVGMSSCGQAAGAAYVYEKIKTLLPSGVILRRTGCLGDCFREPVVAIHIPKWPLLLYQKVDENLATRIIDAFLGQKILRENCYLQIDSWPRVLNEDLIEFGRPISGIPTFRQDPFLGTQTRLVLRTTGLITPADPFEYAATGGFSGLFKALSKGPQWVLSQVLASGLRGRGGAGFSTGKKWLMARENAKPRYIICNADEGDPGAYMNRNELEGDPLMVLEGMLIGAFAIKAREGFIYVRDEYPLAGKLIQKALKVLEDLGICGGNGLVPVRLHIVKGGGAFVCGEETALMTSIQGHPGRPRPRPPYPVEKGLWDRPTVINNVETWANIPLIVSRGGNWYKRWGTEGNSGTKVFSIVGRVKKVGLVEVPLGTRIKELLAIIGEETNAGIKALQTGGPSGGCLPRNLFSLPLTYEALSEAGSIMGSGGMVVCDQTMCMVALSSYFLSFCLDESCGKCLPCREGLWQVRRMVERIRTAKASQKDLTKLEDLCHVISKSSLCGLGITATNPLLSTLKYFRQEYLAHLEGSCPAGVCFHG